MFPMELSNRFMNVIDIIVFPGVTQNPWPLKWPMCHFGKGQWNFKQPAGLDRSQHADRCLSRTCPALVDWGLTPGKHPKLV